MIVFVVFIVCILLSIPICLTLGFSTIWPIISGTNVLASFTQIVRYIVQGMNQTSRLAAPMFILSGVVMARGGISEKLFDVFAYFLGDKTAGMPCTVIVTCLFYGAISGSASATAAAVGAMCIPVLLDLGYDRKFVAATVAAAGGLGVIIPPSVPFVNYAVAVNVSVGDLFIAGIIPGTVTALSLMVFAIWYCKHYGEDKAKIQKKVSELRARGGWTVFKEGFWALLSPVVILGGIYSGIFTPTEAAAVSVLYSLIVSLFVYKTMSFRDFIPQMVACVKSAAPIYMVLGFAYAFSTMLTLLHIPTMITDWIIGMGIGKVAFWLIILVIFIFLWCFIDTVPMLVIFGPILLPTLEALKISPIHFGVVMVMCSTIGLVTPPFGMTLFVSSRLTNTSVMGVGVKAFPYAACILVATLLVAFIPQIAMCLI